SDKTIFPPLSQLLSSTNHHPFFSLISILISSSAFKGKNPSSQPPSPETVATSFGRFKQGESPEPVDAETFTFWYLETVRFQL
ncbi:hypothetical protein LINPERHAP2_LOCUS41385, partial [Linum perenne]